MTQRSRPEATRRTKLHALQRCTASVLACALLASALPVVQAQQPAASQGSRKGKETVTINFVNAEVEAVSRAMATIVNRQIIVDPRVKGTMTLYSEQPLTQREAFLNYLAALRGLGFAVVDVAGLLKVVPEAEAKLQTGTVSVGSVLRKGDQIVTQVFKVQHENVNNLVTVLRPLITPNNTINANPGNNSLVITDYADNLQRLAKIIGALDVPSSTGVEVIALQHGVASDLAPLVQRFADTSGVTAAGAVPSAGAVSVVADPRTNSLLVRAPNAARLAAVMAVIDKLDRPSANGGPGGNIYVVYLKNADATKLAQVLRAAYGGAGGGSSGGSAATGSLASAGQANTAAGGTATGMSSVQATTPVAASASPSTGGFIQADPATNSLIISAPEPVYRQLRGVIDQLDARRAQVYVESMIVKMDATQAAEFGFQWQGLLGQSGDRYGLVAGTNFGTGGNNIVNLSVGAATGAALPGAGLNVGLLKAINGVYTLGALARFLESNTGANVLSTPNLIALDNEEAKIVIGQNVPFVTGSFTNTGTSNGSANPFQTIERKDVGLTLRVKPQIGEGGTVRMVIYQENSSVVANTTTNSAGPTTDKSAIETTVVVDDGSIMVLGGLLKDDYGSGEDRVPGLASIPLIGGLFRSENRKRTKSNLLVFLRPVVMRSQQDANALTLDRYDAIRAQQMNEQPKPSTVLGINESPVLPERKPVAAPPAAVPSSRAAPAQQAAPAAVRAPTATEGPLAPVEWGTPASGR
ncbi:general secretion pathway protein D [Leptothrix cholodnii SP-6]|uniref:General secretion pathway protein D n=1 Tax=Leptothrix cholodnii (strain ATCC 51168 / LMG 8142 / SP-6) TaxID=395495 RepID=B1Y329_LEPCP|nr:type II secretion system secretin GspD [Leptothrix cholodnii]ACB35685.1 general secretion pathway protein D [Leptothrix cholodnii SP-6]